MSATEDPELPDDSEEVLASSDDAQHGEPPKPPSGIRPAHETAGDGLSAFMSSWRMNDLFFMLLQENLVQNSQAWFSVLPERMRAPISNSVAEQLNCSRGQAAFFVSRAITATLHLAIAIVLAITA